MAKGHGERLSREQEKAIACLLTAPTLTDAAAGVGVHPNTLRSWMQLPAFTAAYGDARRELLGRAVERLQHAVFAVTAALVKDLAHDDHEVRHRAAELLLNNAVKATEIVHLTARVSELEARMKERK